MFTSFLAEPVTGIGVLHLFTVVTMLFSPLSDNLSSWNQEPAHLCLKKDRSDREIKVESFPQEGFKSDDVVESFPGGSQGSINLPTEVAESKFSLWAR